MLSSSVARGVSRGKKMEIKIVSGYSDRGGSTVAHINLCNLFNSRGLICTLYGPHTWHLDKCRADSVKNFSAGPNDIIIVHYYNVAQRFACKKMILSCHETEETFPLKTKNLTVYDTIHFVRESQYCGHGVECRHFFCPNVHDDLRKGPKPPRRVAGIIGAICPLKRTHVSILRALEAGFGDIRLFGMIVHQDYFTSAVQPLIDMHQGVVHSPVFSEDKQAMYDSITDVFLSSRREVCSYIQGECLLTGTAFHGNDQTAEEYELLSNDEIFGRWSRVFAEK
jgi:hypothetical protein